MPTRASFSFEDFDRERSVTLIWVQDVSAVNYGSVTQDIDELKDALATITIGAIRSANMMKEFPESGAPVTNPQAQREAKWLITYRDTTQFLDALNTIPNPGYLKLFAIEVPCADLTLLTGNEDTLRLNAGVGATFKANFEANARSPYNHSASNPTIELVSVRHVGRSS